MEENKKIIRREKGGGRKPLEKTTREKNRKESIKKYQNSKKKFNCMLSHDIYDNFKKLKEETNLSYENLISELIKKW